MTTTYQSEMPPASSGTLGGFGRWIRVCANRLAAHFLRRQAIKALQQLDDRQLRDIGLSRCQIDAAVGQATNPEIGRFR
jgi:uncharacterized protein YjiS (DUF1127 family)